MSGHLSQFRGDCTTRVYQANPDGAPMRTLVVDDTPEILQLICAMLETDDGIELIGHAVNGSQAVTAVGRFMPDLVVMDVQMPIMDGLTAAALIRSKFPEVSIILMSACPLHSIENQVRASGADGFIDKVEFGAMFPRVISRLRTANPPRV